MKKVLTAALILMLALCVSVTCFAAAYVPSVYAKDAPELIPPEDPVEPGDLAEIFKDDQFIAGVKVGEVLVTAYSQANEAPHMVITDMLNDAKKDIDNAKKITDLVQGIPDNMIITDLFDVYLDDYCFTKLHEDPMNYIQLIFDYHLGEDEELPTVISKCDGVHWKVIPADQVRRGKNGSIFVYMYETCAVAFLRPAKNGEIPDSPQTGTDADWMLVISLAGVAILGAGACALRKRSN